jgi:hypothetical protein
MELKQSKISQLNKLETKNSTFYIELPANIRKSLEITKNIYLANFNENKQEEMLKQVNKLQDLGVIQQSQAPNYS